MTEPNAPDPRHPRVHMQGPRADVPVGAAVGDLPYAGEPGAAVGRRAVALGGAALLVVLALLVGVVIVLASSDDSSGRTETAPTAPSSGREPDGSAAPTSTTAAPATTTTAAPTTTEAPTTTTAPVTTTTRSPTADIPVDRLARHEAVYRDGKLVLQGTVPSAEIRQRFFDEAAAVIGAENVIVRYRIDPRVPVPTDGRVRVDEDFLFATGSAEIDPRYEPVLQLGVTVMKLNPAARMRVVGYTDSTGSAARNLELSQARAGALKGYLVLSGIAANRIDGIGRGPADPVASNDTAAGRAQNRRIEVELVDLLKG